MKQNLVVIRCPQCEKICGCFYEFENVCVRCNMKGTHECFLKQPHSFKFVFTNRRCMACRLETKIKARRGKRITPLKTRK